MKLLCHILSVVSIFLLLFAGMLHGSSLAGATLALLVDGKSAQWVLSNYVDQNGTDPVFVCTVLFVLSYFAVLAWIAVRWQQHKPLSLQSPRGFLFLSFFVYSASAIVCGIALATSNQ